MKSPGLVVEPNPVVEGQDVEVTYTDGDPLYVSIDGGPWQPVPLDADGNGTVQAPTGSESLVISNRKYPKPENIDVEVISTQGS